MSEIKRVKIQNFVDTQIPEFLNSESPLFKEFLTQYYISQEYQTGIVDLANNLTNYKSIDNFNNETFFSNVVPCVLSLDTMALDDVLLVNHTVGFPDKYGLLKIGEEIITYTGKTSNSKPISKLSNSEGVASDKSTQPAPSSFKRKISTYPIIHQPLRQQFAPYGLNQLPLNNFRYSFRRM